MTGPVLSESAAHSTHLVFEWLALAAGMQLYRWQRRRAHQPALLQPGGRHQTGAVCLCLRLVRHSIRLCAGAGILPAHRFQATPGVIPHMKSLFSPRIRASVLLASLVLVGGTGCITSTMLDRRPESWGEARAREKAHQRHMAELTRAAEAGDPAAATALSAALTATPDPGKIDPWRVTALLSSAAGQGYAPAQAALGEILAEERIRGSSYNYLPLPPGLRDRERGMLLLRQAATQACRFKPLPESLGHNSMNPATTLTHVLRDIGRGDEKRLWDARNAVHCDEPGVDELSRWIADKGTSPQSRTKWLALLLLKQDSQAIAKAEAAMSAEEVGAARREAEQLRRQVAQSEQQYPAPARKEVQ